MLKCHKLDCTVGRDLDHHYIYLYIIQGIPPFGEQHPMQQILLNVCNGDCELVIKLLLDPKERLLFWHTFRPERSAACGSPNGQWALQLLPPMGIEGGGVGRCHRHQDRGPLRNSGGQFTGRGLGPWSQWAVTGHQPPCGWEGMSPWFLPALCVHPARD